MKFECCLRAVLGRPPVLIVPPAPSGAVVDFICNGIVLLLAVDAQMRPLGQVLAH